jgi:hypothetical protein
MVWVSVYAPGNLMGDGFRVAGKIQNERQAAHV